MTIIYRALDYRFVVRAPAPYHGVLTQALAPLMVADADSDEPGVTDEVVVSLSDGGWTITSGHTSSAAATGVVIARVLEHVNRGAAASVIDAIPMHAAAVRFGETGVVALAGRSGAGKSTLCAAAVMSQRWNLLAEEVAAIEPSSLRVRPYHRPVGLRRGGAAALGLEFPNDDIHEDVYPWLVPPERCVGGGQLVGIALVSRVGDPGLAEVRPSNALATLVEHAVVPDDGRVVSVFHQLDELVRKVPTVTLTYQDVTDGIRSLDELATIWC